MLATYSMLFLCIAASMPGFFEAAEFPAHTSNSGCSSSAVQNGIEQVLQTSVLPQVEARERYQDECPCQGEQGNWHRIAYLNVSDSTHQCPSNWTLTAANPRGCGRTSLHTSACDSAIFPSNGRSYSRVCGRIHGYQSGLVDAFSPALWPPGTTATLEDVYIDGLSVTHGPPGSRQHIWSFAVALTESNTNDVWVCACTNTLRSWPYQVPSFVGNNYFCDTGNRGVPAQVHFGGELLYDGVGCGPNHACCTFNNPPWFCVTLPQPTTDYIEVRNCMNEVYQEDILVSLVEIYIS